MHTPDGTRAVNAQLVAVARDQAQPHLYGPLFLVDHELLDTLPVMVFSYDAENRCTYINRAVERVLGYTPDEIYAMRDWTALNVEPWPHESGAAAGSFGYELRQRRKDGREIVMRYNVNRVADARGRVVRTDGCGIDVTAERDAQRQLLLADRLAALGMLVAGIGHEINNPAAYVALGVQQIARHLRGARQEPPDEQKKTLERVLPILDDVAAGVNRIAEIVGELKLFSRNPDADAAGAIDVNGVVRSAAALVQAELRSRARLALDLGELPPAPGAWTRLSQVTLNLLINAAQAIAPGGPEHNEVVVTTRYVDGALRIRCATPAAAFRRRRCRASSIRSTRPSRSGRAPGSGSPSATTSCGASAAASPWTASWAAARRSR